MKPAGVAPATMKLIERFAAFRKRTSMEVLRAYKSQGAAVRTAMKADMQRMLDEADAAEKAEAVATLGDPGAGRFERIMQRQETIKLSRRLAAVSAEPSTIDVLVETAAKFAPPELASDDGPEAS